MKRIVFLFIPWLFLTSFFWSADEEKQLRNLHQSAEAAIRKKDFAEAKESYGELISRIGVNTTQKYSVDWPTYVDIVLRYARACEELGEMQEGEKALSRLLSYHPPQEQLPRINLLRARLTSNQKSPGQAFLEMSKVNTYYPYEKWQKEDLTFYHALEHALNSQYDEQGRKAKRYLVSGYYNEAIALYEEILDAIERGHYPKASSENSLIQKKLRYRLAESNYCQANYEQTLALCYNGDVVEDRIDREMLYLSALCYREKKEYEKALEFFQTYTHSANRNDLGHFDHALFEIGLFYYQVRNFKQARHYFEKLQQFEGKPKYVAALYLARIFLQEGRADEIKSLIEPISQRLSNQDPLRYECCYLQAEAAYALGEYVTAIEFFERSLPTKSKSGEWAQQALFHLALCYMRLGEKEESLDYFSKAEEIYQKLLLTKEKEAATLALGRLHLLRWHCFRDPHALELVETLLSPLDSLDAFLIRAEAAQSYSEKERFFAQATNERFRSNETYAEAWYERGLNHFQEGLKDPANGTPFFEKAATAFARSFCSIDKKNSSKAAHILKLEAKANAYRNSPISSLTLLEKLLTQFNESVEEREETLYLRGLIASRLLDLSYFPIAEKSLLAVIEGNGTYREEALYVLGTLYYGQESYVKAKETFVTLAQTTPSSPFASDAWFWAAFAAEKSGHPDHRVLRAHVYQDYPTSPKAAEAFFRQYPYDDYLTGNEKAFTHLSAFPDRFPDSPLLVVVHYLIGMNEELFEKAKEAFEEAIKAFPLCLEEGKIPDAAYVYFRYQAMLELSQLYLANTPSNEDLDVALHLLHALINDFSTLDHPLTSLLMQKTPYPPLYEEGEFTLVQAYLKSEKKLRAQERLSKMLTHFEEAGVQEGYFLSQVWIEQGKLARQCKDYDTALCCFEIAEECGKGYLTGEQILSLWLFQSHAHRGKKEYDRAMRLLSKVINSDIASPLRLKAMFYRAEVYELQGRPELAIRQLEAMARKGGDWACQAQEKLRHEYGM